MLCPKCGSSHVNNQVLTETTQEEKVKGFGCIKACLGYLIFSIPGILCGLCGMGKGKRTTKTSTKVLYSCQTCGHHW